MDQDQLILKLSRRYYVMMDDENQLLKILHEPGTLTEKFQIESLGFKHRETNDAPIKGKVTVFNYPTQTD